MFRDMDISQTLQTAFAARPDVQSVLEGEKLEFTTRVLTSGLWPTQPSGDATLVIPAAPLRLQNLYTNFYGAQHTGRSLKWSPLLGNCVLRGAFEGGRKELVLSHLQAVILLLFNAKDA